MMRKLQSAGPSSQQLESRFFKSVLSREVALGMERTWHQLTPAMPVQKIVDPQAATSAMLKAPPDDPLKFRRTTKEPP